MARVVRSRGGALLCRGSPPLQYYSFVLSACSWRWDAALWELRWQDGGRTATAAVAAISSDPAPDGWRRRPAAADEKGAPAEGEGERRSVTVPPRSRLEKGVVRQRLLSTVGPPPCAVPAGRRTRRHCEGAPVGRESHAAMASRPPPLLLGAGRPRIPSKPKATRGGRTWRAFPSPVNGKSSLPNLDHPATIPDANCVRCTIRLANEIRASPRRLTRHRPIRQCVGEPPRPPAEAVGVGGVPPTAAVGAASRRGQRRRRVRLSGLKQSARGRPRRHGRLDPRDRPVHHCGGPLSPPL